MSCKVYLLDDHKIIRDGIKSILQKSEVYSVSGEEGDPEKFLEVLSRVEADILLLDLSLPNISGFKLIPKIRSARPDIKIVVLSMHSDPEFKHRCFELGVQGYLTKDSDSLEFLKALDSVRLDKFYATYLSTPDVMDKKNSGVLTQREVEVLKLLANGFSSKQIGKELSISTRTVETHRINIMKKLKTSNSAETISVAAKLNLI
jgi:DNA-binding NarL/FixJ family response regulator